MAGLSITKLQTDVAALVTATATALADEQSTLATLSADIAALKAAGPGNITQADLDALDAKVTGVSTNIGQISSDLTAAGAAAGGPPAGGGPPAA